MNRPTVDIQLHEAQAHLRSEVFDPDLHNSWAERLSVAGLTGLQPTDDDNATGITASFFHENHGRSLFASQLFGGVMQPVRHEGWFLSIKGLMGNPLTDTYHSYYIDPSDRTVLPPGGFEFSDAAQISANAIAIAAKYPLTERIILASEASNIFKFPGEAPRTNEEVIAWIRDIESVKNGRNRSPLDLGYLCRILPGLYRVQDHNYISSSEIMSPLPVLRPDECDDKIARIHGILNNGDDKPIIGLRYGHEGNFCIVKHGETEETRHQISNFDLGVVDVDGAVVETQATHGTDLSGLLRALVADVTKIVARPKSVIEYKSVAGNVGQAMLAIVHTPSTDSYWDELNLHQARLGFLRLFGAEFEIDGNEVVARTAGDGNVELMEYLNTRPDLKTTDGSYNYSPTGIYTAAHKVLSAIS